MPIKVKKKTLVHLLFIGILVISTRLLISKEIHTIYYVDPYYYLAQVTDVLGGKSIPLSRGFPFIHFLAFFFKFLSPIMGLAEASKALLIIINLIFFHTIYLALTHLIDETSSFFATIFSIFEISILEYSLVPYLEMFALLTAWLSLLVAFNYFKTSNIKWLPIIFTFSILSGLTRFEMFTIFYLPIMLVIIIKNLISNKKRDKHIGLIVLVLNIVFLIIFGPNLKSYYYSTTRFDPFTKIIMGLRYDVINNVLNAAFAVTRNENMNFAYMTISVLSIVLLASSALFSSKNKFQVLRKSMWTWIKDTFNDKRKITFITYALIVFCQYLYLIAWGYSYVIEDGSIKISVASFSNRNLINIHILLVPLPFYFISKIYSNSKSVVIKIRVARISGGTHITTNTVIIICFLLIFLPNMWSMGIERVSNDSNVMAVYRRTAEWLVKELPSDQQALLPLEQIFYFYYPELKNNTSGYEVIWKKAGVILQANTTYEELLHVRKTLIKHIMEHPNLHFLVLDWMDPITRVFKIGSNDELSIILKPVHREKVETGTYRPEVVIYEIVKLKTRIYETSFIENRSKIQVSSRAFGNCIGTYLFDQGLTIKLFNADSGSSFRVYLPLKEISIYNFSSPYSIALSLKLRGNLEQNCKGYFTLYFDKNGDGVFDYTNDYVTSFILSSDMITPIQTHSLWFASHNEIGKILQIAFSLEAGGRLAYSELTIESIQIFILG